MRASSRRRTRASGARLGPDDFDTVYDLVHFYQDFLDTLPDERVTLIGCSFGGWLAAEIAVNYGHRLDRLVLVDPVGIKVGGREERDIVHHFNTSPAELARLAWHDPTKQRPGLLGLGWQQHLDATSDEESDGGGAGLGLALSVRLAAPPVQPQIEALASPHLGADACCSGARATGSWRRATVGRTRT